MARNRASAKKAGTAFETLVARYLNEHVDDGIERRTKAGNRDRGDIGGLRHGTARVVVECKDVTRMNLAGWVTETDTERSNDDAAVGIVIHKRRGTQDPGDQYVTMTVRDLVSLLTGTRP